MVVVERFKQEPMHECMTRAAVIMRCHRGEVAASGDSTVSHVSAIST